MTASGLMTSAEKAWQMKLNLPLADSTGTYKSPFPSLKLMETLAGIAGAEQPPLTVHTCNDSSDKANSPPNSLGRSNVQTFTFWPTLS
jgi:hypothetical protein